MANKIYLWYFKFITGIDAFYEVGGGYCKVSYIADYIFIMAFSIYLGFDVFTGIGDNIRVRIFMVAFLSSIRSM